MTTAKTSSCPKCDNPMEKGFTVDGDWTNNSTQQTVWHQGEYARETRYMPQKHLRMPVTMYRCTHCGYLEAYALEGDSIEPSAVGSLHSQRTMIIALAIAGIAPLVVVLITIAIAVYVAYF